MSVRLSFLVSESWRAGDSGSCDSCDLSLPVFYFLQIEEEINGKERAREHLARKYAARTGLTQVRFLFISLWEG